MPQINLLKIRYQLSLNKQSGLCKIILLNLLSFVKSTSNQVLVLGGYD